MKFLYILLIVMACLFLGIYADASVDVESNRVIRQAPAVPAEDAPNAPPPVELRPWKTVQKEFNLADPVSEDYPIIFNIILFISVALVLALIAISVAISTMDPGRDSLIYRVTTGQKSKKDN